AAIFMCGGPHFLRIFPRHLPNLCAIPWIPLILMCVEGVIDAPDWPRRWSWVRHGSVAVALQLLAGHPQYVYYTALVGGIYATLNLSRPAAPRRAAVAGLLTMALVAAALGAVQWLPGLFAVR